MLGKDWRQEKGMTGWESWMASPTQWTWVRASPRSWWRTGKPGTLHFMGSQSQMQLSDWTELNSHQHCNSGLNEAPLTHTSSGRHSQPSGCGTLYSTILEDHFSQWNSPTKRMKMWKMWHQTLRRTRPEHHLSNLSWEHNLDNSNFSATWSCQQITMSVALGVTDKLYKISKFTNTKLANNETTYI